MCIRVLISLFQYADTLDVNTEVIVCTDKVVQPGNYFCVVLIHIKAFIWSTRLCYLCSTSKKIFKLICTCRNESISRQTRDLLAEPLEGNGVNQFKSPINLRARGTKEDKFKEKQGYLVLWLDFFWTEWKSSIIDVNENLGMYDKQT